MSADWDCDMGEYAEQSADMGSERKNEFLWHTRVYYEDTDAGGLVYHANYLKYFERARTEWLRSLGIEQSDLLKESIAFVVRKAEVEFIAAAKFDQQLRICCKIIELKRATILFEQTITNYNNTLLVKAVVSIACVNLKKMKPCRIPDQVLGEFSSVV